MTTTETLTDLLERMQSRLVMLRRVQAAERAMRAPRMDERSAIDYAAMLGNDLPGRAGSGDSALAADIHDVESLVLILVEHIARLKASDV